MNNFPEIEKVPIVVSQMLSAEVDIIVPKGFDFSNEEALKDIVREQIILPHEVINDASENFWGVDDFCVMI